MAALSVKGGTIRIIETGPNYSVTSDRHDDTRKLNFVSE